MKRFLRDILALLAIASALVAVMTLFPNEVLDSAGRLGGEGTLSFPNPGQQAISSISFKVPSDLAQALKFTSSQGGWTSSIKGDVMTLSGGTLNPGATLLMKYSIVRYVKPRQETFATQGVMINGQTLSYSVTIIIQENVVLRILSQIVHMPTPTPVGAFAGCLILLFLTRSSKLKIKISSPKEGDAWEPTNSYKVAWSVSGNTAKLKDFDISVFLLNKEPNGYAVSVNTTSKSETVTVSEAFRNKPGKYVVRVRARDDDKATLAEDSRRIQLGSPSGVPLQPLESH